MNCHYSIVIQWSEEDGCFVVMLPEFIDVYQPVTHGQTYEEAAIQGHEVLETLIEIYRQDGKSLPKPITLGESLQVA